MPKTIDRKQLQRQNTQISAQEQTNLFLAQIVALLEQANEAAGLPPLEILSEETEAPKTKRGLFG